MKIVLHHDASPGLKGQLARMAAEAGDRVVDVAVEDRLRLTAEMQDADVLFHVLAPVTEAAMAAAPNLRLIQKIGVGVDTIDLVAARRRSIKVANMPGTNSQAVAEMALLLMLGALRRFAWLDQRVRMGTGWLLEPDSFDHVGEISGRTVGLVGYGQVARRLEPALTALGATVIYHSRTPKADNPQGWRPLVELIAASDVISLHIPLTQQTTRLIDRTAIRNMKRGAVLVNTARGGLVDEAALIDALQSGHLAAAGLDALAVEPAPADNPLFALDNVVVTPHVAWLTPQTLQRSLAIAFGNCRRLERGEPLLFQVESSSS